MDRHRVELTREFGGTPWKVLPIASRQIDESISIADFWRIMISTMNMKDTSCGIGISSAPTPSPRTEIN
jgi:hypothetical protein